MRIVVDTNIALDWLLFADSSTRILQQAIDARRVSLLVNELVLHEFQRVLGYPQFKLEEARQRELLARYTTIGLAVIMPADFSREHLLLPKEFPTCRDRDDQHFLALAYHAQGDALVTRDKALLKLRRKVARFGVRVVNLQELNESLKLPA